MCVPSTWQTGLAKKKNSVIVHNTTLAYAIEGEGMPMLVVGSSIFYPRTFSQNLRANFLLVCADLPHPLGEIFGFRRRSEFVKKWFQDFRSKIVV
jgi:hypothetical protein